MTRKSSEFDLCRTSAFMSAEAVPNETETNFQHTELSTERHRKRQLRNDIVKQTRPRPKDDYQIVLNGGRKNLRLLGDLSSEVPSVATWTITLVHSAPPPNHHHHLQWYSTDLSLYLMFLHPLLKLYLQCLTLTIIIAPQTRHILSQPGRSQLITRPSGIRKHSKNQLKI